MSVPLLLPNTLQYHTILLDKPVYQIANVLIFFCGAEAAQAIYTTQRLSLSFSFWFSVSLSLSLSHARSLARGPPFIFPTRLLLL